MSDGEPVTLDIRTQHAGDGDCETRLRPRALIVADNADWSPEYLARVRGDGSGFLSVPFGGEVELSMRLGG